MQFIEELVDYFVCSLTDEQLDKIRALGVKLPDCIEYYMDDGCFDEPYDDVPEYDYEEYDTLYDSPAKAGKSQHSAGKRRPLRRPETTAAELAAIFKEMVRGWGCDFGMPGLPDLLPTLAAKFAPVPPAGRARMGCWRRFTLMVEVLKDLDADALAEALAALIAERRQREWNAQNDMFIELFECGFCGDFGGLAKAFCWQQVNGKAAKAVLAALRNSTYPERSQRPGSTNISPVFLRNRDVVTIFNFYRIQRKLEYIISQTVKEAMKRLKGRYYSGGL